MGVQENGLTLEGLAHRLEAVERDNERMCSENAALRDEVAKLRGSDMRHDGELVSEFEGQVSRKALLSKAAAAAVAAVAAGTLLNPREAKASHYSDGIRVDFLYTHRLHAFNEPNSGGPTVSGYTEGGSAGAVQGRNDGGGPGVEGIGASGPGVQGNSGDGSGVEGISDSTSGIGVEGTGRGANGTGVKGTGRYGVWGESNQAGFYGVFGRNTNTDGTGVRGAGDTGAWGSSSRSGFSGVYGQHTGSAGYGLVGDGKGSGGAGVLGRNNNGTGVRGEGSTTAEVAGVRGLGSTGVWGSSSRTGYSGLYGQHTGSAGYGVVGDGTGATGAGVVGRNGSGYGGQFEGGKAQLFLKPKGGAAGRPTTGSHLKGELYMDSEANLFVCTADGSPGTWKLVRTVAVS
ncbi:MAG: hypothetical protein ACRDTR_07325 [Rubrobacter sp.]